MNNPRAYDARWSNDIPNAAFAALTAGDFEVIPLGYHPTSPSAATNLRVVTGLALFK